MANNWRMWDGSKWISPCECNIYLRTAAQNWHKVDPRNCPTRYWDGHHWCPIICDCVCDPPYIFDEETGLCYLEGDCQASISIPSLFFKEHGDLYEDINILPAVFTSAGTFTSAPISTDPSSMGTGLSVSFVITAANRLVSATILSVGTGYYNNEEFTINDVPGVPSGFKIRLKTELPRCPDITYNKCEVDKLLSSEGANLYADITLLTKPLVGAFYCGVSIPNTNGDNYKFKRGPIISTTRYGLTNCTVPLGTITGGTGVLITPTVTIQNDLWYSTQIILGDGSRANKASIWAEPVLSPATTECAFATCYFVEGGATATKQIFLAITTIETAELWIDNVLTLKFTNANDANSFLHMQIFPVTLSAGLHQIKVKGKNTSTAYGYRRIMLDIYDMGFVAWPTANSPSGYLTAYDKFVGEIMTPTANANTILLPQDGQLNPYLHWSTQSLLGLTLINPAPPLPYGDPVFTCADGTTTPIFCGEDIICDSYPCEGEPLTELTEINIFLDNSGSMSQTGPALYDFYENTWKPCLILNVYGSLALFNQRVRLYYMDGTNPYNTTNVPNIEERPVAGLATLRNFDRPVDLTVNRVFNLTFADESDVYGYGLQQQTNFDPSAPCNLQWITDVQSLRNAFLAAPTGLNPYEIKTINFTVHSDINNGVPYPTFDPAGNLYGGCVSYQSLMIALGINNGNYNQNAPSVNFPTYQALASNVSDYYMLQQGCSFVNIQSVLAGQASWYYDSLLRQAFSSLNVFVPYC